MKNLYQVLTVLAAIFCFNSSFAQENAVPKKLIENKTYKLYKPDTPEATLILFGGFPETAENIENEFPITNMALQKNVAVAYLNFNRKLWLDNEEKSQLANSIQEMIMTNNLPSDNIFIGGISSGGDIALLIGDYLAQNSELKLNVAGVFAIDSPVDLAALYRITEENIKRNYSEAAVGESSFINNYFKSQLGNPDEDISLYEKYSLFTFETKNCENVKGLKNTDIRFYTEPDKDWWKENMGVDYEEMNAFHLKRFSDYLKSRDYSVEYITTKDKGYRANGARNPHSWSIVDKQGLLEWILEN